MLDSLHKASLQKAESRSCGLPCCLCGFMPIRGPAVLLLAADLIDNTDHHQRPHSVCGWDFIGLAGYQGSQWAGGSSCEPN